MLCNHAIDFNRRLIFNGQYGKIENIEQILHIAETAGAVRDGSKAPAAERMDHGENTQSYAEAQRRSACRAEKDRL